MLEHFLHMSFSTMLAQKAGTVLECKKDRSSGVITVSCSDARHAEMPDWSIMFAEDGRIVDADERHRQVLEERRVNLQQKRQEAQAEKLKDRLDYALRCIRDHGGSISRKQLTAILCSKFELKRPTVSLMITQWREDGTLLEVNGDIHASNEAALAF
jgi:uncharacterized membrane protein